ncbi:Spore protein SP21 [Burkholderiales bacterium]|nr:Spore protein SP21 [Burkholderiales bacterium]
MRTLTRWNPFPELARFDPFGDPTRLWGEVEVPLRPLEPEPMMRLDIAENDTGYVVKADIPGVTKEDIAVSLERGMVSISVEVKREKEASEGGKVLRNERYHGYLARSFTLPVAIDMDKAVAAYEGGVLTLTLPKASGSAGTRLAIH